MKTIYNTFVVMESQEQCDRIKQLCIDNGLDFFDNDFAFYMNTSFDKYFEFDILSETFYVSATALNDYEITETEFIELLKTTK